MSQGTTALTKQDVLQRTFRAKSVVDELKNRGFEEGKHEEFPTGLLLAKKKELLIKLIEKEAAQPGGDFPAELAIRS